MKYRKKPVVIEATQWFKNGDHPSDGNERFTEGEFKGELYEGKVVRYYRTPECNGAQLCKHCGKTMHEHGWVDTLEGGHIVCPGDWVIKGVKGEFYPCKNDIFEWTYKPVESSNAQVERLLEVQREDLVRISIGELVTLIAIAAVQDTNWPKRAEGVRPHLSENTLTAIREVARRLNEYCD